MQTSKAKYLIFLKLIFNLNLFHQKNKINPDKYNNNKNKN